MNIFDFHRNIAYKQFEELYHSKKKSFGHKKQLEIVKV